MPPGRQAIEPADFHTASMLGGGGRSTEKGGEGGTQAQKISRDGICKQSKGARNRKGKRFIVPARLATHSLAELIHWNRFLGSINV